MNHGGQVLCAAVPGAEESGSITLRLRLRDNGDMPALPFDLRGTRLRKHADYQRVYKASRKHFSSSMSYFFRLRGEEAAGESPRVGLTAGRVLGKAVERNRIKRRMREAVRLNLSLLPPAVDVVLHPRKSVIDMEFAKLEREVAKIFSTVASQSSKPRPEPRSETRS